MDSLASFNREEDWRERKRLKTNIFQKWLHVEEMPSFLPRPISSQSVGCKWGKEISSQESRVCPWRQAGHRRVPCVQGRRNSWRHRSGPHITLQTCPRANSPYILCDRRKLGCHTESTVHLLRALDAPGNNFSICWSFWAWGKNSFSHQLCCHCPCVTTEGQWPHVPVCLQTPPTPSSAVPRTKKCLRIPLPSLQSTASTCHCGPLLWAGVSLITGILLSAPQPQSGPKDHPAPTTTATACSQTTLHWGGHTHLHLYEIL